jgi:hypothetical protein
VINADQLARVASTPQHSARDTAALQIVTNELFKTYCPDLVRPFCDSDRCGASTCRRGHPRPRAMVDQALPWRRNAPSPRRPEAVRKVAGDDWIVRAASRIHETPGGQRRTALVPPAADLEAERQAGRPRDPLRSQTVTHCCRHRLRLCGHRAEHRRVRAPSRHQSPRPRRRPSDRRGLRRIGDRMAAVSEARFLSAIPARNGLRPTASPTEFGRFSTG